MAARPEVPTSRTIPALVAEIASRAPDRPAVIARDRTLSYRDLDREGARLAAGLAGLVGGPVGLLCTNRPEWLVTMLAAGRLGAPLAAFDTWSRAWDLEHLLTNSGAEVLVTLDRFRKLDYLAALRELVPELDEAVPGEWRSERFPRLREVVVIGDEVPHGARPFEEVLGDAADAPAPAAGPEDVGLILHTSGSTARPKGVPLVHRHAIENGFDIGERMALREGDRVWVSVPLFWSYGSANATMATFGHGATIVLQEVFEPGEALEMIERHACTAAYLLPNIIASLLDHERFSAERTATLRTGLTLGTPEDLRRAAEHLGVAGICNVYGSTETYGNCCVTPTELPLDQRMHCQGPPLPGASVRIVDPETGERLPVGETGEVLVGGHVVAEYLNDSELTRRTFTDDGWYRTGDLGYFDDAGHFHFVARASDMIKSGGINISPLEVETCLQQHPAVRLAVVLGRPAATVGELAVAFVELQPGATATEDGLRSYCAGMIASYKVPAQVIIRDELPTTDTGKLNRRALAREL